MQITKNHIILLIIIGLILAIVVTYLSNTFNIIIFILCIFALLILILNFYLERKR